MASSKQFSFRLPDDAVQAIELLNRPDESLNQTAQRLLLEILGVSTEESTEAQTSVVDELRSEIENLRSQINVSTPLSTEAQTSIIDDLQSQIQQLRSQMQHLQSKLVA